MQLNRIFFLAMTLLGAAVIARAQSSIHRSRSLPGERLELKTQDGWTLSAQYARAEPDRPTFILLHEAGRRKEDWSPLARAMVLNGFGVLGLDLRGHGRSQNPPPDTEGRWWKFKISKDYNEWMNMSQDVDAAVEALKSKGVSENMIALGGADVGSSIALRYAAVHPLVPMVFMLSPGVRYQELLTVNAMRAYGNRPILFVVGQDDRHSMPETGILYQFARSSSGPENVVLINVEREHGTKMLTADPGLIDQLINWMEHPTQTASSTAVSTSTPGIRAPVPGVMTEPADSSSPQNMALPKTAVPAE